MSRIYHKNKTLKHKRKCGLKMYELIKQNTSGKFVIRMKNQHSLLFMLIFTSKLMKHFSPSTIVLYAMNDKRKSTLINTIIETCGILTHGRVYFVNGIWK